MAIRTKSELMELLKNRIGEDTSDEALTLIEDFTDTLDSMENEANDGTDWKTKYEQNDAEWRQKYKNRFFNTGDGSSDNIPHKEDEPDEPETPMTFNDLFKEGE